MSKDLTPWERPLPVRTSFVHVLNVIFNERLVTHDRLLVGRIIKSLLPILTPLLSQKTDGKYPERPLDGGSKRGKKRTRGFEGDEIFSSGKSVSIASPEEGQLVLSTLQRKLNIPIPEVFRIDLCNSTPCVASNSGHPRISSITHVKGYSVSIDGPT